MLLHFEYYILRLMLLHFALVLHFAAIITFWGVTIAPILYYLFLCICSFI